MNTPLSVSFAQAHNTGEKGSREAPREKKFEVFPSSTPPTHVHMCYILQV